MLRLNDTLAFEIEQVELDYYPDTLIFSTRIDYRFTPEVEEALRHGVPIVIALSLTLKSGWRVVWEKRLFYRLEFAPLSGVYRLIDLEQGIQQGFVELKDATATLGRLEELLFALPERRWQEVKQAEVVVWLDRSKLPWPLWPLTLFDPQWQLKSPVYHWSKGS